MVDNRLKEVRDDFTEEWERHRTDRHTTADLGDGSCHMLLHILNSASKPIREDWKTEGATRALKEFISESSNPEDLLLIEDQNGTLRFDPNYSADRTVDEIISAVASTWSLEETPPEEPNGAHQVYIRPSTPHYDIYDDNSGGMKINEDTNPPTIFEEIGIASDESISPTLRIMAIWKTLAEIENAIIDSNLTPREFITHHLANTHIYTEIAAIINSSYDTDISKGAVSSHNQRADTKIGSAEDTIESTTNGHTATAEIQTLEAQQGSALSSAQKTHLARTIRKVVIAGKNTLESDHIYWDLNDGSTLAITLHTDSFSLSMYQPITGDETVYLGGTIMDDPDAQTDLSLANYSENTTGEPTQYRFRNTANRATEQDIIDAFVCGCDSEGLGKWNGLSASSAQWDEDDKKWVINFISSIDYPDSLQSQKDIQFGCWYDPPEYTGIEYTYRVVQKSKYDTIVQWDDGTCGMIATDTAKDASYIGGGDSPLLTTPCPTDMHDFGNVLLTDNNGKTTPCEYCGYTVDTLQYANLQANPKSALPFECQICGKEKQGKDGNWRYEMSQEERICNNCWSDEYFAHVDKTKDELENYVMTCNSFLTSVYRGNYPEDVEWDANCKWIAKPTEEIITHYLQEAPENREQGSAIRTEGMECPSCGRDEEEMLRLVDVTDGIEGQALMETLAPESTEPNVEAIFSDQEGNSRILSDETHSELLNTYHRLDEAQKQDQQPSN